METLKEDNIDVTFDKTWMYVNWIKAKEYSKSYLLWFDKWNWKDKSCEVRWKVLNWIIIIDDMIFY